jgi:gamma-glutamyltranspeptidase/glutathione hydrolase
MNVQDAVDAPRFHHQWLPDRTTFERNGLSPDTLMLLKKLGHTFVAAGSQGVAEAIVVNWKDNKLEGGCDRRAPDGGAIGY